MVARQSLTFEPTVVIDTSAASNSMKLETADAVEPFLTGAHRPVHSFQTEQELITWGASAGVSAENAAQVGEYLEQAVIIDSDREIDRVCAEIVRGRLNQGEEKNTEDAWTCAVAVVLGVPVVTYDGTGFSDVPELEVILLVAP